LAERRPHRNKWFIIGVPALALLGGGTALAAATGKLPQIVEAAIAVLTGEAELEETPSETGANKLASTGTPNDTPEVTPPEVDEAEEAEPIGEEAEASEETPGRAGTGAALLHKPKADGAPEPALDPSLEVYRAAHEAHFKNGDCEGAVRGYRKYLRDAPSGTFFLEAKYNLGVCLARLGRTQEARDALTPFAEGKYGDYRKSQSKKLLDALGSP
jgi:TolA-binding protein